MHFVLGGCDGLAYFRRRLRYADRPGPSSSSLAGSGRAQAYTQAGPARGTAADRDHSKSLSHSAARESRQARDSDTWRVLQVPGPSYSTGGDLRS